MAQEKPTEPRFAEWLQATLSRGNISRQRLYQLFILAGGDCSPNTMDRYRAGLTDPPEGVVKALLRGLATAPELAEVDVYEEYERYLRGRFDRTPRRGRGFEKPEMAPLMATA